MEAALEAGREILCVYEGECGVEFKADKSPVTQADRLAHEVIQKALAPTGLPFLSEEGKDIPYEARKGWEAYWLVDPLDGTKEFLNRNGEFTVNIALIRSGKPVLGVVYAPALKVLYYAAEGVGAYRSEGPFESLRAGSGELQRDSKKLYLADPPKTDGPLRVVASRSHRSSETESFLKGLGPAYQVESVSAGSSLKFCRVAEGKADLYPRLGPTMEWDTAAGQTVAEQAGGAVCRWGTTEPLGYNKPDLHNPAFWVGNPGFLRGLQEMGTV